MISKTKTYFLIAAIPVLVNSALPPSTWWGWIRLIGSVILAGMTAVKALQSDPVTTIPPVPPKPSNLIIPP